MNERERAELEYYRQVYANPEGRREGIGGPPAAQDALSDDELAAFWPDDLDYEPKYRISERYRQIYEPPKKAGE